MSSLDLPLLHWLNGIAAASPAAFSLLRVLAVWGPLWAAWEVALPWLRAEETPRALRITRDALMSGAVALLLATLLGHFMVRGRPFLSHPVTLLYLPPNDSCFPDRVTALAVGMTLGALHDPRNRWLTAVGVTAAWLFARMASGAMFPSDVIAGLLLGALPMTLEVIIQRADLPANSARAGAVMGAIILGAAALGLRGSKLPLPAQSTSQEQMMRALPSGQKPALADPRLKGYLPAEEARLLAVTDALFPPPPVMRVEVARAGITVAGVKLLAGTHWDSTSRAVTEWQAARLLKAAFLQRPELAEVDLWAVVPYAGHGGKVALRPVLFTQARRTRAARLIQATPRQLLFSAHALLRSLGDEYLLERDFPRPGEALPNGVAEGAG